MAKSVFENPNFNWFTWNPTEWEDTTEDTVDTTVPVTGGITSAYTGGLGGGDGGVGYVPKYLPRDAEGFQIQPFRGSGTYLKQYTGQTMPDGTPILSGYTEEEEDPNLLQRFGIGAKKFLGGITSAIPVSIPNMINRAMGRPSAIYSYPGDVTGYGSRAGITQEELRNMELLEQMGGINEKGQDIYGINVVSGFGDYTEYRENRQTELENQFEKSKANWTSKYGSLKNKNQFGKTWEEMNKRNLQEYNNTKDFNLSVQEDEEEMDAMIMKKEKEARRIRKGLKEKKDTLDITPTVADTNIISAPSTGTDWEYDPFASYTGPMIGQGPLHDVTAQAAKIESQRRTLQNINAAPAASTPTGTMIGAGPLHGAGGGGYWGGVTDVEEMGSFAKGGRVGYGNGGIVDLL